MERLSARSSQLGRGTHTAAGVEYDGNGNVYDSPVPFFRRCSSEAESTDSGSADGQSKEVHRRSSPARSPVDVNVRTPWQQGDHGVNFSMMTDIGEGDVHPSFLEEHERSQHARHERIRRAFHLVGTFLVFATFCAIVYFNYVLARPIMGTVLMALLAALALVGVHKAVVRLMIRVDHQARKYRPALYTACVSLCGGLYVSSRSLPAAVYVAAVFAIVCLLALFADRQGLSAAMLTIMVGFVVLFPIVLFIKTCYEESVGLTSDIIQFIETNQDVQLLLKNHETSEMYIWFREYAESWGWDVPKLDTPLLKAHVVSSIQWVGTNARGFFSQLFYAVNNAMDWVFSLFLFLSCLFYFLLYCDDLRRHLRSISPFGQGDNRRLLDTVRSSASRIFLCSLAIGLSHGLGTYLCLTIADVQRRMLLAFLSGFFAMTPLASSWMIDGPLIAYLVWQHVYSRAAVVAAIQLSLFWYIDPAIYGFVPGGNSYFIGLSVALGVYSYGPQGTILGPLLVATLFTILDMYNTYMKEGGENTTENRDTGKVDSGGAAPTAGPVPGRGRNATRERGVPGVVVRDLLFSPGGLSDQSALFSADRKRTRARTVTQGADNR